MSEQHDANPVARGAAMMTVLKAHGTIGLATEPADATCMHTLIPLPMRCRVVPMAVDVASHPARILSNAASLHDVQRSKSQPIVHLNRDIIIEHLIFFRQPSQFQDVVEKGRINGKAA